MPLYTYQCTVCNLKQQTFRCIVNRDEAPECCGTVTHRLIEAPRVEPDLPSYTSPIDGRWIDGRKARNEDLKRNGCIPYDLDFKEECLKKQKDLHQDTEKAIDRIVEQTAADLGFNP